jgi:hypothetical protein
VSVWGLQDLKPHFFTCPQKIVRMQTSCEWYGVATTSELARAEADGGRLRRAASGMGCTVPDLARAEAGDGTLRRWRPP